METNAEYDSRYLEGIRAFNDKDFFAAHEIWEDLWNDCPAEERRFYQGLIQAAVALHHWGNGNWRGARRLFFTGRQYMLRYPDHHLGLHQIIFWQQMEKALAQVIVERSTEPSGKLDESECPLIILDPPASADYK